MCSRPVGRMPLTTRLPRAPSVRAFFSLPIRLPIALPGNFGVRRSCRRFLRGGECSTTPRVPLLPTLSPLKREQDSRTPKWHSQFWLCGLAWHIAPCRAGAQHAAPLREQIARDDHALNLAGAFVDRDDARVAVHALDIGLARVAHAAMYLHRFIDYAIHHLAGIQLRFRG